MTVEEGDCYRFCQRFCGQYRPMGAVLEPQQPTGKPRSKPLALVPLILPAMKRSSR